MSRNYYVTFGGAAYDATLARIASQAKPLGGVDDVWIYDEPWLAAQPFRQQNKWAWDHYGHNGNKYGHGWYVWKPHVIRRAMEHLQPGDVLLYTDADTFPIADFRMLFDACRREGGIFVFEATGCSNRQWVKRDVWEAVFPALGADLQPHAMPHVNLVLDSQHATARFMLFEKQRHPDQEPKRCMEVAETFLAEWESLCCVPGLTTRDPSKRPEFPGFEENRGDQSIFSLLCLKYGLPLHREADAFGEASDKDRELYGQLFEQIYCQGDRNDLSGSKYRRIPE